MWLLMCFPHFLHSVLSYQRDAQRDTSIRNVSSENRFVAKVDFKPKIYADIIFNYSLHPDTKFADSLGGSCKPHTRGLLCDQEVHVERIASPSGSLEYGGSEYDEFLPRLREIPTKDLAKMTATIRGLFGGQKMAG